jgi:hypothetical protein
MTKLPDEEANIVHDLLSKALVADGGKDSACAIGVNRFSSRELSGAPRAAPIPHAADSRGLRSGGGAGVHVRLGFLHTVRGGLIVRVEEFLRPAEALEVAGLDE